jgi:hypothetical protein
LSERSTLLQPRASLERLLPAQFFGFGNAEDGQESIPAIPPTAGGLKYVATAKKTSKTDGLLYVAACAGKAVVGGATLESHTEVAPNSYTSSETAELSREWPTLWSSELIVDFDATVTWCCGNAPIEIQPNANAAGIVALILDLKLTPEAPGAPEGFSNMAILEVLRVSGDDPPLGPPPRPFPCPQRT